jgi:hypothetical protein
MEVRIMAERAATDQRMADMFQYMQSLSAAQGFAPPPPLFPAVDPVVFHTTSTQKLYSGGFKPIYTGVFQYRQC